MSLEEKIIDHESFGMIGVSRCSCNAGMNFHGSDVKHSSFLTLRIYKSEIRRHLHKDWHHSKYKLVEVELTHAQFSEMISNMNCGDGVPCTITALNGKRMERTPDRSKKDEYIEEFSKDMDELSKTLHDLKSELKDLKGKNGATQADKTRLLDKVEKAVREIDSNVPFIKKSFNKSLDRAVGDAKRNIEGHVMNIALSASSRGLVDNVEKDSMIGQTQNFIEMSGE